MFKLQQIAEGFLLKNLSHSCTMHTDPRGLDLENQKMCQDCCNGRGKDKQKLILLSWCWWPGAGAWCGPAAAA